MDYDEYEEDSSSFIFGQVSDAEKAGIQPASTGGFGFGSTVMTGFSSLNPFDVDAAAAAGEI